MTEKRLFKYVAPDRIDILERQEIAFTPPSRFNDPFDMHPAVAHINDPKLWDQMARDYAKANTPKNLPRKKRLACFRQLKSEAFNKFRKDAAPFTAGLQSELHQQIDSVLGALCLSAVADIRLMWAHYANKHTGFLIEFDCANIEFQNLGKVYPVKYSAERPVVHATAPQTDILWLLTKSKDWEYEEEYRILRPLAQCKQVTKDGLLIYLFPLAHAAIKAVYLGASIEKTTRERIFAALSNTAVQIFQTELHGQNFSLTFAKLK